MKRWQDRGEVLDSDDDEDLDLETEDGSPARKKARLGCEQPDERERSRNGEVAQSRVSDSAAEDEEEWLRPKVANSYGRKVRDAKVRGQQSAAGSPVKAPETTVSSPGAASLFADRQDHVPAKTGYASHEHVVNGLQDRDETPFPSTVSSTFIGAPSPRPIAPEPTVPAIDQAQSSDSEDLPDVQDLVRPRDAGRGQENYHHSGDILNGLSSPLSEPPDSPSGDPPIFHLPEALDRASPRLSADAPNAGQEQLEPSATPIEVVETEQNGRRTFRTRNAQQLHPYEYERLQYQKQFRDRGLRTVRIVNNERHATNNQNGNSSDTEQDSWQPSQQMGTSPARPSSDIGTHANVGNGIGSDDELPDIVPPARRTAVAVVQRGPKRQKVAHDRSELQGPSRLEATSIDDFSVPPSPPPTSSESNDNRMVSKPAVFKYPRGMTPKQHTQQPTPNVSSDLRRAQADSDDDIPPRSRPSTISRSRHAPIPVESSTESSESDSEVQDDPDVRRLLKERKRIHGVLPASWLKIDFKAQQKRTSRSPEKRREERTQSPEKAMPQKGVAQRISSRAHNSATQPAPIPISDDESDNDLSSYLKVSKHRQSRLQFDRAPSSTGPTDFVDDERMEADYVDAMLAGSSRPKSNGGRSKKRQPRIKDAFAAGHENRKDFAEERNAQKQARGTTSRRSRERKGHTRRRATTKPSAPCLSILDAPRHSSSAEQKLPQFVRLAIRRADARADHGRHSPSRKHIRLATKEDTEEATSILKAWREGTVAPRQRQRHQAQHLRPAFEGDESAEDHSSGVHSGRPPLTEVSVNHQSRLPAPVRTKGAKQQAGARKITLSRPKLRQSRLEPISRDDEGHTEHTDTETGPPAAQPAQSHEQHKRSKTRPSQPRYKGAQLESLEAEFDQGHRAAAFERRMNVLTENVARKSRHTPAPPMQLERFLHDADRGQQGNDGQAKRGRQPAGHSQNRAIDESATARRTLAHRPRKRAPQRVDAEAREYRQPSEPLPEVMDLEIEDTSSQQALANGPTLQCLGPFGTRYPINFDTLPLPLGTYFHETSFIGSGDFAASLDFAGRNLDVSTGRIRVHVDGEVLDLGIWNEEVAVGLAKIPPAVADALRSLEKDADLHGSQDSPDIILANVDYLLRSTVRYFARCLAFSDPIDRKACIQSLQRLVEDVIEAAEEDCLAKEANKDIRSRCLQYATVLARQVVELSKHPVVTSDLLQRSQHSLHRAADRLAAHFGRDHLGELRQSYEDLRHATKREAGIRDSDVAVCSITVLHHSLEGIESPQNSFWSTLFRSMGAAIEQFSSVSGLDQIWGNLFTILPALEIDARGILKLGSRFQNGKEDWTLCKALVERLFKIYPGTSSCPGSTINEYVRATLTRCARLQARWGWCRCEPILYSISDFFARRGLSQLHLEQSHGSPTFLQELHQSPSLEVRGDERSFQLFLKLLASGLRSMRERGVYPDKKIGGIAWRFIPNHGRTHRKDADVRQEDLDALRNHHDLLCTLYYASPPNNRIRVDLIQNLVDHTSSHREACRLSVRAWRNLAAYQASTGEPVTRLAPFNDWFQELLIANIMQFRLARTEVEQDVASAVAGGEPAVSQDIIETTIAANQRQIAATITDALSAVKHCLKTASSSGAVLTLVEGTRFWQGFELFDPSARKVFSLFEEGLEVIKAALAAQRRLQSDDGSQSASDDSQDYGDSSALQELASTQMPADPSDHNILDIMHPPLADFVSRVFGADHMSEDDLLSKVVDVWVEVANLAVSQGKKTWQSYISGYGSEAWSQLRDTEQRRKYTPYFLAKVVEMSDVNLDETGILPFWLKSLVEREATLKFQHALTNALLNRQYGEPWLVNLPFIKPRSGQFAVSLQQLRQCRLGLVSSVLSNMHQHVDETLRIRPARYSELRRAYADMLRQMMQAMKLNYQEVQVARDGEAADPHAQGEYVGFVQQIVSFLQQYTADILPVDRFFTDSSAFPLPTTDPTYVVGRLKGYVPKLSDSGKRKELAVFVQTVSERAAVDGQQECLVDQLTAAMIGVLEQGNPRSPSLRHILMTAIFPAYIDNALSSACSWILALPILQSLERTMRDLLYRVNMEDESSVRVATETLMIPTQGMISLVESALAYPGQMTFPHVLATLRIVFETARQSLPTAYHISRASSSHGLIEASTHLLQCAIIIEDFLSGNEFIDRSDALPESSTKPCQWQDTQQFSKRQFQDNLKGWHARDGQYFMRRGSGSVEVVMQLGDEDEERERLVEVLKGYRESYNAIFGGGRGVEPGAEMAAMDEVIV